MWNLISPLMEYSRIEKKESIAMVDFNDLLIEVKEDLSIFISSYNAKVTSENLPALYCYLTFMRMLIQNLISNAIKFTAKDSIPEVKLSSTKRELDWLFAVQWSGN
jgi:light-regulated signal transduction histidine kinase (bacteriophytochrome)